MVCGSNGDGQNSARPTTQEPAQAIQPTAAPSVPAGAVTVINRDQNGSGEYRFDPSEFGFKVGQEVIFALVAQTEFHTFTVDDLGIDVSIEAGTTELITFKFDKAETYDLICIPHQSLGMTGQIVVE